MSEDAAAASIEIADGIFDIRWQLGERQLCIRAKRKRQLHYYGQLLEGDTGLLLGKVSLDAKDTLFSWRIQLVQGRDADGELKYCPLYDLLIQPLALAPSPLVLQLSGEHYLLIEQFLGLIESYLGRNEALWDLYYSSCHYGGSVEATDILAISVFRNISSSWPDSVSCLWRHQTDYSMELSLIPEMAMADNSSQLELFNRVLDETSGLSLFGTSAFLARHLPGSMPLLGAAIQSWYSSIDDNECLLKVLQDIARDIERNQEALSQITYKGQLLPLAQAWSLGLMALSDYFTR